VFALEWQPQWSQPPSCDEKLANHLSPDSYAATHFSVHGLWPNYDSGLHNGSSWPQYCTRPVGGQVFTDCESDPTAHPYCTPSGAATLFNTSSGWQRYGLEYAWSDLARHEWAKHGSCTPWTQERYFEHIQDMHGRLANGSGAALAAANVGGSVAREDLAAAFQKDTDGKKVAFNCDPVSCFLSEVWTAWAADPAKKLAPAAPIDYKDIKGGPCPVKCMG